METIARCALTFLANSFWQVASVTLVALGCDRLMRKAGATSRHVLWVMTLVVSVALPSLSLLKVGRQPAGTWREELVLTPEPGPSATERLVSHPGETRQISQNNGLAPARPSNSAITSKPQQECAADSKPRSLVRPGDPRLPLERQSWLVRRFRFAGPPILISPLAGYGVLACYLLWILVHSFRLWSAWKRTRETCRHACPKLMPAWMPPIVARCQTEFRLSHVPVLYSSQAAGPLTLGIRHPVIILPQALFQAAAADDLTAALCHEMVHIRRHDFLLNLLYEFIYLPLSFHPAARLVKRRIDETRELACDEIAAGRILDAPRYAQSLVSIAHRVRSLVSGATTTTSEYTLGIFDANILEERIMSLLDQKPRAGARAGKALLALAYGLLGAACLAAVTLSVSVAQENKSLSQTLEQFTGVWQATFKGKAVFVLKLRKNSDRLEGTLSGPDSLSADAAGNLTEVKGEPHGDWPIVESKVEGRALTFKVRDAEGDIDAFELKLSDRQAGEFTSAPPEPQGQVPLRLKMTKQEDKPKSYLAPHNVVASSDPTLAAGTIRRGSAENRIEAGGPTIGVTGGIIGGVVAGVPGGATGGVAGAVAGGVRSRAQARPGETAAGQRSPTQSPGSSISGTVFDPSGARVPQAIVSLSYLGPGLVGSDAEDEHTKKDWSTATDDTGDFSITGLPPGDYRLEVSKPGFARYQGPWTSDTTKLQVVLEPGTVFQMVEVTARAPEHLQTPQKPGPQRIRIGGLVQATKLVEQTQPEYPEQMRAKGIQGIVLLRAVISKEGEPIGLKVLSSPDPELSQAATDAVSRWRYEPTLLNGEPVEVVTTVAVRFHLED